MYSKVYAVANTYHIYTHFHTDGDRNVPHKISAGNWILMLMTWVSHASERHFFSFFRGRKTFIGSFGQQASQIKVFLGDLRTRSHRIVYRLLKKPWCICVHAVVCAIRVLVVEALCSGGSLQSSYVQNHIVTHVLHVGNYTHSTLASRLAYDQTLASMLVVINVLETYNCRDPSPFSVHADCVYGFTCTSRILFYSVVLLSVVILLYDSVTMYKI